MFAHTRGLWTSRENLFVPIDKTQAVHREISLLVLRSSFLFFLFSFFSLLLFLPLDL